jgi:hypothetical protein
MHDYPDLWKSERDSLRRAFIILTIIGPYRRPGGYLRKDIENIAGTHGSETDRLIEDLVEMGILRRRKSAGESGWARYNHSSKPRSRYLIEVRNESARRQVRDLLASVWGVAKQRRFEMDKDYDPFLLTPGTGFILVGEQPPRWFKEVFKEFWSAFRDAWYDSMGPRLNPGGRRPSSRQAITQGMERHMNTVLDGIDAISQPQISEWKQFWNKCHGTEIVDDLMKARGARKYRGSFVLFSVGDLET